jgi:uncharacterized membrane protein YkvA (DUF1232 family)
MDRQQEVMNVTKDISTTVKKEVGFWREIVHQARLVYHLLRDPEVPIYLKLVPFIGVIYLLFPFDFVPDFILGLGQLDDLTVLLIGSKIFMELAPPHVVAKHRHAIRLSDGYEETADILEAIVIDGKHQDAVGDGSRSEKE